MLEAIDFDEGQSCHLTRFRKESRTGELKTHNKGDYKCGTKKNKRGFIGVRGRKMGTKKSAMKDN